MFSAYTLFALEWCRSVFTFYPRCEWTDVQAWTSIRSACTHVTHTKNTHHHTFSRCFYGFWWKWHKFVTSYIAIQSLVVGINFTHWVAVLTRYCFLFPLWQYTINGCCFVISWASSHSCIVYICATNTQRSNQLKHFFLSCVCEYCENIVSFDSLSNVFFCVCMSLFCFVRFFIIISSWAFNQGRYFRQVISTMNAKRKECSRTPYEHNQL